MGVDVLSRSIKNISPIGRSDGPPVGPKGFGLARKNFQKKPRSVLQRDPGLLPLERLVRGQEPRGMVSSAWLSNSGDIPISKGAEIFHLREHFEISGYRRVWISYPNPIFGSQVSYTFCSTWSGKAPSVRNVLCISMWNAALGAEVSR